MKLVGLIFGILGIVAMFCMCIGTEFVFNAAFYRSEGEEKLLKAMQAEIDTAYARHPVYGPLLRAAQKNAKALADNNVSMQAQNESALKGVRRDEVRQYNTSINENVKTSGEVAALIERAKAEIEKPIRERYAAAIANARGENTTGKLTSLVLTMIMPLLAIFLAFFRESLFENKIENIAALVGGLLCQLVVSYQSALGNYRMLNSAWFAGIWLAASVVALPLIYVAGAKLFVKLWAWYKRVERKKAATAEGNGFHAKPQAVIEQDDEPVLVTRENAAEYVAWLYVRSGEPKGMGRTYGRVAGFTNTSHTSFMRLVKKYRALKMTEAEVKRGLSERTIAQIESKLKGVEA